MARPNWPSTLKLFTQMNLPIVGQRFVDDVQSLFVTSSELRSCRLAPSRGTPLAPSSSSLFSLPFSTSTSSIFCSHLPLPSSSFLSSFSSSESMDLLLFRLLNAQLHGKTNEFKMLLLPQSTPELGCVLFQVANDRPHLTSMDLLGVFLLSERSPPPPLHLTEQYSPPHCRIVEMLPSTHTHTWPRNQIYQWSQDCSRLVLYHTNVWILGRDELSPVTIDLDGEFWLCEFNHHNQHNAWCITCHKISPYLQTV